jgi:hypothetical protein
MLDQMSWVKISKQCHSLVDEDCRVIATISTAYDESDGDENFIWDAEIEGEEFGSYVSLYLAKLAIQTAIFEWDSKVRAEAEKKTVKKKVVNKKPTIKKEIKKKVTQKKK